MKIKKIICGILAAVIFMSFAELYAFADAGGPVLSYTFENSAGAPSLFGNAALVYDENKGGNVLSLDGTNGTYAEIPQGFFDGRNVMTIMFDVLTNQNGGNYFTFTFGANNEKYDFFRIRDNEIRNAITLYSYQNEQETRYLQSNLNRWMNIALVYNGTNLKMYVDGELVSENGNTGINVSDLGTNLYSYLGKSLYDGDGYFSGYFDNFEVYDRVLSNSQISEKASENITNAPVLQYTFEDNTFFPTLHGNAKAIYENEKKSKVLYLDGTDGTFAELPQGFFDGRDNMTVMFDIKSLSNSGNYFTFAFGTDSTRYDFFRIRGSEIRNAITVNTYYSEQEVKTAAEYASSWLSVAIVFSGQAMSLYVNGTLAATNENTGITVSDLGSNLLSYLGKSFYDGDGYFNGYFDNFEVYNGTLSENIIKEKAKNHLPLLISATVGEVIGNLDGVSGTDSHTAVSSTIDRSTGDITSIIQRRQNVKAVPVNFYVLNTDCQIYVDGVNFGTSGLVDLSADRSVVISHNGTTEEYTLKAAQIANNPVLPGMYADPDIDILGDRFWIFPTTDGTPGWGGSQFHAFSSRDMVHWTDEGVILDNKNKSPSLNEKGVQIASSAWSDGNAWAPAIEEKNGKYYFYYCGRILEQYTSLYGEGMAIGVAWANSPAGPYTASTAPILYPKMLADANIGFSGQVIDPAVFTDTDGTSYLLFGNGMAAIATLNSDMLSVNTSSLYVYSGLTDFRESIAVFKRDNYYYFTWSCDDTGSENYHINYATSNSLKGRISNRGTIIQKDLDSGILATGHQSVIYLKDCDRCFIAYHRFYTPLSVGGNVGHRRETCIEELTFKRQLLSADLINAVTPSMSGVGPIDVNGNNLSATITYPTCTSDGFIDEERFILNADEAPEVKATGHRYYLSFEQGASCAEGGYKEYRCALCGDTYKEYTSDALRHDPFYYKGQTENQFIIRCNNCDLNKVISFEDYLNLRSTDSGYDVDVDINGDGIINAKDFALLTKTAETE